MVQFRHLHLTAHRHRQEKTTYLDFKDGISLLSLEASFAPFVHIIPGSPFAPRSRALAHNPGQINASGTITSLVL
jgi:hypothetical protein